MARQLVALDLDVAILEKPVRALSKGTMQKLGLAACLLAGPSLLVLDEPMSGLDPKARASVRAELGRFHSAGGTLLFTTHGLADIDQLCDRMLLLHAGSVRFHGSPRELVETTGTTDLDAAFLKSIES